MKHWSTEVFSQPPWLHSLSILVSLRSEHMEKAVWPADVFNVDLRLSLNPRNPQLSPDERAILLANIQLLRDAIVLFTATGAARGVSGHTGMS